MRSATLLFENGPVLTQDKRQPESDALAVVGNRIAALGEEARALRGPSTRVVDLAGRALVPGFVDAHNHLVSYGVRLMRLDLSRARGRADLLESVRERARMTPSDGWIVGHSWDESAWEDPALPSQEELDAAAGGRAALLARVDRHGGLASSAALAKAGLAGGPFVVEHEYDKLVRLATPTLATLVKGVQAATRRAHELGITSSHVICAGEDLAALQAAREAGALGVRVSCYVEEAHLEHAAALGVRRGLGDAWVRVMGVKLYADGSFGSRTAAISFDYKDRPGERGMLLHPEGRLEALVARAKEKGLQVAVHAIGDRTARRVLDAFEMARVGPADRARIEHLELVDDADVARAARMGVVASVQPNFTGEWGHRGGMYETRLGWDRARRLNRFAGYQAAGVPVAFGSDDMPLGPLHGMRCAAEAPEKEQRVGVEEALRAYTAGAAWAAFAEEEVGTLREGALADLVVLSRDPRAGLDGVDVDLTVVDGRVVHERALSGAWAERSPSGRP
ncbi:MAG TPA: amidohydrolase [Candidatus Thermoplasmatota archaeon]|nr:amidohydrolase [Candidatus Thermoplasmatota archaeon]